VKTFTVTGTFAAEGIDDALAVLAAHFSDLRDNGLDGEGQEGVLSMEVKPLQARRSAPQGRR
jgi:hypothetical protein